MYVCMYVRLTTKNNNNKKKVSPQKEILVYVNVCVTACVCVNRNPILGLFCNTNMKKKKRETRRELVNQSLRLNIKEIQIDKKNKNPEAKRIA